MPTRVIKSLFNIAAIRRGSTCTMSTIAGNITPFPPEAPTKILKLASTRSPACPISPKHGIHNLPLIKKKTLVEGIEGKICPVRTFTFALPDENIILDKNFHLDLGDTLKLHLFPDPENPEWMTNKSYSPTNVSKPGVIEITVKIYPTGKNTQYLDNLEIGDIVGMSGPWRVRTRVEGKFVNMVCFGVGMTEVYHVAKAELEKGDAIKVKVLYCNRHKEDAFFTNELEALANEYGDRFELTYMYSREDVEGAAKGRVDSAEVLREIFDLPTLASEANHDEQRFLIIGTKPMMRQTWELLQPYGYILEKHGLILKN